MPSSEQQGPVLCVEDSLPYMRTASNVLEDLGLEVAVVANGDEALRFLPHHACGLLLAHAARHAPPAAMQGFELCRQIRLLPGHASLPIIFFLEQPEIKDILTALRQGVDALLPFDSSPGRLWSQVQQVLSSAARGEQGPTALLFGDIQISTPLSGARTCNLLLSCICHDALPWQKSCSVPTPSSQAEAKGGGLRAIIADDTPTNLFYLTKLLENMGHAVQPAENGTEALRLLREHGCDVVLLDIQMPVMNGLEALKAIRAGVDGLPAEVPVIAVTAHGFEADRRNMLQQGFDEFVCKPIEPEALAQAMASAIKARAGRTQAPSAPAVTAKPDPHILDKDKTLARLRDTEFVSKLYTMFLSDLDKRIAAMHAALEENNLPALRKLAHSLKGAVVTLDAQEAREHAYALECAAKEENAADCEIKLKALLTALATLRDHISQYLERGL